MGKGPPPPFPCGVGPGQPRGCDAPGWSPPAGGEEHIPLGEGIGTARGERLGEPPPFEGPRGGDWEEPPRWQRENRLGGRARGTPGDIGERAEGSDPSPSAGPEEQNAGAGHCPSSIPRAGRGGAERSCCPRTDARTDTHTHSASSLSRCSSALHHRQDAAVAAGDHRAPRHRAGAALRLHHR